MRGPQFGNHWLPNLNAHPIYNQSYKLVQILFLKKNRLQLVKIEIHLNIITNNQHELV